MILIYFALCFVILIASPLGVFPKVKWDGTASESGWVHIMMHPTIYYRNTGQSKVGVYAQERVEQWLKWFALLAPSIALSVTAYLFISENVAIGAALGGLIIGLIYKNSALFNKQLELVGHTTESIVAGRNGFDFETYLEEEAERTLGNSIDYPFFKGLNLDEMIETMKKRIWISKLLIAFQKIPLNRMKN